MKYVLYVGLGLGAAYVAYRLFLASSAGSPAVVQGAGSTSRYQTEGGALASNFANALASRGISFG